MEYEVYEPDPDDEYYDQACSAAYAYMFNGRSEFSEGIHHPDDMFFTQEKGGC